MGNMHKKFGEIRQQGFRVMRADRQTNKQADNYNTSQRHVAKLKFYEPM